MKTLLRLLLALLIAVTLGTVADAYGFSGLAVGGLSFVGSLIPKPVGVALAGISLEVWEKNVEDKLFTNSDFIKDSIDVSSEVLNGSVVHIPNAGAPSAVVRNRQLLPAAVKRRVDIDRTYVLDEFTTDPVPLLRADKIELSYDKVSSVLKNDMDNLNQTMAEWMLYNWRPDVSKLLSTTGGNSDAYITAATGTRKALVLADLRKAQAMFDLDSVPDNGRFILLDAIMYQQLLDEMGPTVSADFRSFQDPRTGILGQLYGFNFRKRSSTLRMNAAKTSFYTPDTAITALAATDNAAALVWQDGMVERAVGTIQAFQNLNDPTYYGDIYSFLVRAGGSRRRADNKGVMAIVQG